MNPTRRDGVQIAPVTKDIAEPLGLKEPQGALVRLVERGGPAAAAGIQPGDVIVRYNNTAIAKSDELVENVTRTKPGTTVPVEVIRDGQRQTLRLTVGTLELEEQGRTSEASSDTGFGMSLRDLSSQVRNQLDVPSGRGGAVVATVERGGAAARAGVRNGDVILEVNRSAVGNTTAAALRRVPENDLAFVLVWRQGQEVFLTMSRR